MKFQDYLKESSLSRIWTFVEKDKYSFGILSAFRDDYDKKGNMERHKQLKKEVRDRGYGYIEMDGAYPEGGKTAKEKSLFIPNISKKDIIDLGIQYEQDSVMYKDAKGFVYIGTNEYTGVGKVLSTFAHKSGRGNIVKGLDDLFSALTKGSDKGKKFLFQMKE